MHYKDFATRAQVTVIIKKLDISKDLPKNLIIFKSYVLQRKHLNF